MISSLYKSWRKARRRGLRFTACVLFGRIVPSWLFCCELQCLVSADSRRDPLRPVGFDFHRVRDAGEMASVQGLTPAAPGVQGAASFAVVAERDGQLIASAWGARGFFRDLELGLRVDLPEDCSWLHSAKVVRTARGQGVFAGLIDAIIAETRGEVYAMYHALNKASASAFARQGRDKIGSIFILRLLGATLCVTRGSLRCSRSLAWRTRRTPIEIRFASQPALAS